VACPCFCFCSEFDFVAGLEGFCFHSCLSFSFHSFSVNLCMFSSWRISPEINFSSKYGVAHSLHFVEPPKLHPPFSSQSFRQNSNSFFSSSLSILYLV